MLRPPEPISCPYCTRHTGRLMREASERSVLNYVRCDVCTRVWTVDKVTGSESPTRERMALRAVPGRDPAEHRSARTKTSA